MIASKTKSINMNFSALYSYVMNNNYRSFSGVLGLCISAGSIIILLALWGSLNGGQKIMFILLGLIFTVINPVSLAIKTYKQLKLSPSYKKPLEYTFGDDGITIEQEDTKMLIEWKNICRIMMSKKMIAIYTGRMYAFVIPLSELGDDKAKIVTAIVQFTMEYKPRLSKNLKEYQSGKGI